jgi:mannose PTS system EIIA component
MITLIIVTHGNLADELLKTAQMIFGKTEDVHAVCFSSDQEIESLQERISGLLEKTDGHSVLFLTDMLGGSAFTASMKFLQGKDRYLVTGVNLPILLDILLSRKGKDIEELISQVKINMPRYSVLFPAGKTG